MSKIALTKEELEIRKIQNKYFHLGSTFKVWPFREQMEPEDREVLERFVAKLKAAGATGQRME
jgi:hypothetical protein